jgi:hypothetical protein
VYICVFNSDRNVMSSIWDITGGTGIDITGGTGIDIRWIARDILTIERNLCLNSEFLLRRRKTTENIS